ncbi:MAG: hypothetical protein L6R40_006680 [Gallowayella cf. fulva]|nr:MAG: hypothetical protein L6R40_006680 [Xanthomendoza cf. fulva]
MAPHHDRAPMMLAVFCVFFLLPLIAVTLRFVSRRISHLHLWWDDWLILAAAVIVILNFAFLYQTLENGAGKPFHRDWPPERLENFFIYTYANEIVYASIVTCIKSSVLCLYLRLFGVNKKFAMIVKGFIVIVLMWGVAVLLTTIFQCNPVKGAWDISVPRDQCFNLRTWLIATNVPNIVIDFSIICLPIPLVWKLKLSTERKIGLTAVFLLGTFASVISIVRVHTNASLEVEDPTWNYVFVMIWSTVEGNVGVICACCPVLAPLVRRCFGRSARTTPRASKEHSSSAAFWRPRPSARNEIFSRLDEEDTANLVNPPGSNSVHIKKSSRSEGGANPALELSTIYVTGTVEVESTKKASS